MLCKAGRDGDSSSRTKGTRGKKACYCCNCKKKDEAALDKKIEALEKNYNVQFAVSIFFLDQNCLVHCQ